MAELWPESMWELQDLSAARKRTAHVCAIGRIVVFIGSAIAAEDRVGSLIASIGRVERKEPWVRLQGVIVRRRVLPRRARSDSSQSAWD